MNGKLNNNTDNNTDNNALSTKINLKIMSYFCSSCKPKPVGVIDIEKLQEMVTTDQDLRAKIEQLRGLNPQQQKIYKAKQLPLVTAGGVFSYRDTEHLLSLSGYMFLDLDDVKDLDRAKGMVLNSGIRGAIAQMFTSPRGGGIKILVRRDMGMELKTEYGLYMECLRALLGDMVGHYDTAPSSVASCTFLSYDPEAYFNREAEPHVWENPGIGEAETRTEAEAYTPQPESGRLQPIDGGIPTKVKNIVFWVERRRIDFAETYEEWRDLAFALSGEYGEQGRGLYKRLCRFSPKYNERDTEKMYDEALGTDVREITMGTFWHMTGQHVRGIYPRFIESVIDRVDCRDEYFIKALFTVLASVMTNVKGSYSDTTIMPSLFTFIVGESASGKGKVSGLDKLLAPIDGLFNKRFRMSANVSTRELYNLLEGNGGRGLMFDTEADTLTSTMSQKWASDFSPVIRKAFTHERISLQRAGNGGEIKETNLCVEQPCFSLLLTGTPGQVMRLCPDSENGEFSRYLWCRVVESDMSWMRISTKQATSRQNVYDELGETFYKEWYMKFSGEELRFEWTDRQEDMFNERMAVLYQRMLVLVGTDFAATMKRIGIIMFRFCMILASLRLMEEGGAETSLLHCTDDDFELGYMLTLSSLKDAEEVLRGVTEHRFRSNACMKDRPKRAYLSLPDEFDVATALDVLKVPERTLYNYLVLFTRGGLLFKTERGRYRKVVML